MYSLIFKGEKGFFTSDGFRLLFPDRSWKDVKVGLVRNTFIKRDMETYAFITAETVDTFPITLQDLSKELNLDYNVKLYHCSIEDIEMINLVDGGVSMYYFKTAEGIVSIDASSSYLGATYRNNIKINKTYSFKSMQECFKSTLIDETTVLQYCVNILSSETRGFISMYKSCKFKVYDNRFIEFTIESKYGTKLVSFYYINLKFEPMRLLDFDASDFKITREVDISEVKDYCVGNFIAVCNLSSKSNIDDKLVDIEVNCLGDKCIVQAYNGVFYKVSLLNSETGVIVSDSVKRLDDFRKKLGKVCGKSGLEELSKSSARNILFY